ncbi:hypothetical protein H0H87_005503 [Tephrocybe sp. NHM501043]|nr:hypothetical protein H0H87_005503 [Tephrocybe sp. NHM501043]
MNSGRRKLDIRHPKVDLTLEDNRTKRHPDIELLSIEDLCKLAEAAEKYEVFGVMNICKIRMKELVKDHPKEAFDYASRHGYHDILSMAAPLLVDIPPSKIAPTLSPHLIGPWVRQLPLSISQLLGTYFCVVGKLSYQEHWSIEAEKVMLAQRMGICDNCRWDVTGFPDVGFYERWCALGRKRSRKVLQELRAIAFKVQHCGKNNSGEFLSAADLDKALDAIPAFDTFL